MSDDFFALPPPPPEEERRRRHRRPPWVAPSNIIPAPVPILVAVARTDDVAVVVSGIGAHPTGFSFELHTRIRPESEAESLVDDPLEAHRPGRRAAGELAPEVLRFGVQYPDGARATNVGGPPPPTRRGGPPSGPVLSGGGGGGGGGEWHHSYHLWPLPGEGTMAFVCAWPAVGIPLTRAEIDTAPIREAASRAVVLWDLPEDDDGGGRSGWTAYGPRPWP